MERPCLVRIGRTAEKQLKRIPGVIREALYAWARSVEELGIRRVRMLPGYHDEPLHGARHGQRSVRLNRAYRVIYEESEAGRVLFILVLEVNKHDY